MIDLKFVCDDLKYKPAYANESDACMDLKVKIKEKVKSNFRCMFGNCTEYSYTKIIAPHSVECFDTGVKFSIPSGYSMEVFVRSSTGCKLNCQLANSTGIIDEGYKDNVKIFLYNFSDKPVVLEDGQRVAQFKLVKDNKINLVEVEDDEEFRQGDRQGGFGSSGTK